MITNGEDITPPGYETVFEDLHIPADEANIERDADQNVPFVNCKRDHNVSLFPMTYIDRETAAFHFRFIPYLLLLRQGRQVETKKVFADRKGVFSLKRPQQVGRTTLSITPKARQSPRRIITAQFSCSKKPWGRTSYVTGQICYPMCKGGPILCGFSGRRLRVQQLVN